MNTGKAMFSLLYIKEITGMRMERMCSCKKFIFNPCKNLFVTSQQPAFVPNSLIHESNVLTPQKD